MPAESRQDMSAVLEGRRFSFYPAIRGIEDNEWAFDRETWSEILVKNAKSGREVWIPRNHLGEVSSAEQPVLIVGLLRELEFKAGSVVVYRKVVTGMPQTPVGRHGPEGVQAALDPPRKKFISGSEAQTLKLLGVALSIGFAVALIIFAAGVAGFPNPLEYLFRPDVTTADQRYLSLAASDGYHDIAIKMAAPEREQWMTQEEDELQFQALWYGSRSYIVILMGGTRADMRYIGTLHDPSRRVLDAAVLAGGGDTASMMRNLPEF